MRQKIVLFLVLTAALIGLLGGLVFLLAIVLWILRVANIGFIAAWEAPNPDGTLLAFIALIAMGIGIGLLKLSDRLDAGAKKSRSPL